MHAKSLGARRDVAAVSKGFADFTGAATDRGVAFDTTVVRSGVRYNDAYGPRYYGSTIYGDWY